MDDVVPEGEVLEIDEPKFECLVCEEMLEFEFDPGPVEPENSEELPEEFEENIATPENFTEEVESDIEENSEETMRIDCECGAEYLVKKIPGVPGFEVTHLVESEPELAEKEFEQEFEV
ncbi:MAG: hypothetical protein ACLFTY_03955 [Candidatus Aenigmatarchaeota archaeon]